MWKLSLVLIFISHISFAKRLCDIYDFIACPDSFGGSRSTTSASYPNNSAAFNNNPASMTTDRGVGIEVIGWDGAFDVGLVAGTGVIGSGFSTNNTENTFFGGRPIEEITAFKQRHLDENKYKSEKYTGVVAVNLIGKKKTDFLKMNMGIIGKYNDVTSQAGAGLGLSLAIWQFSFGAARIQDNDVDVDGETTKTYYTNSANIGAQFGNFAIDWTYIRNNHHQSARIRIFTATMYLRNWMLTWGNRKEESFYPDYDLDSRTFEDKRIHHGFLGVQYIWDKRIILGLFHNYYLMNETSLGLSAFF